MNTITKKN